MACLFFVGSGLALSGLAGIEDDESLFAEAIYRPRAELFTLHLGRSHVPIMLMSYLGALKSLIYKPIFLIFGPGIYSLRVPMVLAGAGSVWLFFLLLRRIAGYRAAIVGCAILAVDASYLLTICFDWGPVALQHLLLGGGALLLVRFYQETTVGRPSTLLPLAGGFFLFGLALWDKALAVWMLSGLAIGTILVTPRHILAVFTRRRLLVAVSAFTLGVLPLLIYNVKSHGGTLEGNVTRDTQNIPGKARFLMRTETAGLFGWLNATDWQTPQPHAPRGPLQAASARISAIARQPKTYPLLYAFVLALLIAPLAGANAIRAIGVSLIAMAVAWIQMAINANTGASVHHTILLWPLPALIVAVSFAGVSRRIGRAGIPALATVSAVLTIWGALVINEYYVALWRYGGAQAWTDAIYELSTYVKSLPMRRDSTASFVCLDWGLMDPLRLLNRGQLPLMMGSDPVSKPEMSADDRAQARWMLSEPANIYLAHTEPYEFFKGNSTRLIHFAEQQGYRREMIAVIPDHFGRPVYEVYRFAASAP